MMSFEEMVVAIIAIVGGLGFTTFLFYNLFNLIKHWINRKNNNSSEIDPQFFKALSEFKKNTERRITNLETIVSDLEEEHYRVPGKEDNINQIEIEEEELRSPSDKDNDSNLRNMLNE